MDKLKYAKLKKNLMIQCLQKGFLYEDAEDFAQEFIFKKYTNNTKQKIKYALVDFTRKKLGRAGFKTNKIKTGLHFAVNNTANLEHIKNESDIQKQLENKESLENFLNRLTAKEKYIISSYLFFGKTQREIADSLSLDESRISQMIKHIKNTV